MDAEAPRAGRARSVIAFAALAAVLVLPLFVGVCSGAKADTRASREPVSDILAAGQ
jgi:hypothetical protein